jgi:hypothetical protein
VVRYREPDPDRSNDALAEHVRWLAAEIQRLDVVIGEAMRGTPPGAPAPEHVVAIITKKLELEAELREIASGKPRR